MPQVTDEGLLAVAAALKDLAPSRSRWRKRATAVVAALAVATLGLVTGLPNLVTRLNDQLVPLPNHQNVPLPRGLIGPVSESSYRQDSTESAVHPGANVLDGDADTTWVECRGGIEADGPDAEDDNARSLPRTCPNDPGLGEWLQIPLSDEGGIDLKAISLRNGSERNTHEFLRNPRVRDLQVDVWIAPRPNSEDSTAGFTTTLADALGYQTFPCHFRNVTQVRLTIRSIYPGEDINRAARDKNPQTGETEKEFAASSDTALSDVLLVPRHIYRAVEAQG